MERHFTKHYYCEHYISLVKGKVGKVGEREGRGMGLTVEGEIGKGNWKEHKEDRDG